MKNNSDYEELIKTYDEYLEFLQKANESTLSVALAHGWSCDLDDIKEGLYFRNKIEELKTKLEK